MTSSGGSSQTGITRCHRAPLPGILGFLCLVYSSSQMFAQYSGRALCWCVERVGSRGGEGPCFLEPTEEMLTCRMIKADVASRAKLLVSNTLLPLAKSSGKAHERVGQ